VFFYLAPFSHIIRAREKDGKNMERRGENKQKERKEIHFPSGRFLMDAVQYGEIFLPLLRLEAVFSFHHRHGSKSSATRMLTYEARVK
jgi:hypothetical protein